MQGTIREPRDLAPLIDHTLLKADATDKDIEKLCEEAVSHGFKAVCVMPIFVGNTRALLSSSHVLTAAVVGFPLGAHDSRVKALETEIAVAEGAHEIDMMARLDLVKAADWKAVERDVANVVDAAGPSIVKVILETGLLSESQIAGACRASEAGGAAFVKTSTGFLSRGASLEDVKIMRANTSKAVKIKASGGIKNFAQAVALIDAGAERLGTSSGIFLVTGRSAPGAGY